MEFSNPSIFSYLMLIAIPIIIHLFNLENIKRLILYIHLLSQIKNNEIKKQVKAMDNSDK